jgi:hypothetical protein
VSVCPLPERSFSRRDHTATIAVAMRLARHAAARIPRRNVDSCM